MSSTPARGPIVTFPRPEDGNHPPNDSPGYRSTALRHPKEPLVIIPQTLSELTGPVYPYGRIGRRRQRPHAPACGRAARRAHHRRRAACSTRTDGRCRRRWSRSGRPTRPDATRHAVDQHEAPLDPNFSGAGRTLTDDDGRYRFVTIQPGRLPVEEPPQRLAAGAHPFLAVRHELPHPADHADVLPGRPAAALRPDLQLDPRRARARAADRRLRPRTSPSRSGRSGSTSTSCCADRAARRWRPEVAVVTPFQTVGPFFDFGLDDRRRRTSSRPEPPTACTSSVDGTIRDGAGDPVPDAIVEIWQANAAGRYRHPADEGRAPLDPACDGFGRVATIADGRFAFATVMPGRVPGARRRAGRRRTSLVSVLARGVLTRLVDAHLLRRRSGQRRRSGARSWCPSTGAARSSRAGPRPNRYRVRHRAPGTRRDGVLRCLTTGRAVASRVRGHRPRPADARRRGRAGGGGSGGRDRARAPPRTPSRAAAQVERYRRRGARSPTRGRRQPRHPAGQAAHPRWWPADEPAAARYVHWGATSQDIIDTGLVLQLARRRSRSSCATCAAPRRRRPTTRGATPTRRWPGAPGCSRRRR